MVTRNSLKFGDSKFHRSSWKASFCLFLLLFPANMPLTDPRNHPDVSDACVIGVPDDFSKCCYYQNWSRSSTRQGGEVPRAYVVLTEAAAKKAKNNPEPIKASIAKVHSLALSIWRPSRACFSWLPTIKSSTSIWQEGSYLFLWFPRIHLGRL